MLGGFSFKEAMVGSLRSPNGGAEERTMSFRLTAHAPSLLKYLRDRKVHIEGEVDIEGIAVHAPLRGELMIDPVIARVIDYAFDFVGDDRKSYRFSGRKEVTALRPLESMTTLRGELRDQSGALIGEAELKFALGDLPTFLGSFRPW